MERIYADRIAKGATPEAAANFAVNRALVGGVVQGALFEVLPAPLRKAGDKVTAFAKGMLSKFLLNRVAQGAEGAVMGAGSAVAANVAAGREAGEGVAEGAAGLGAIQAL